MLILLVANVEKIRQVMNGQCVLLNLGQIRQKNSNNNYNIGKSDKSEN